MACKCAARSTVAEQSGSAVFVTPATAFIRYASMLFAAKCPYFALLLFQRLPHRERYGGMAVVVDMKNASGSSRFSPLSHPPLVKPANARPVMSTA